MLILQSVLILRGVITEGTNTKHCEPLIAKDGYLPESTSKYSSLHFSVTWPLVCLLDRKLNPK